MSDSKKPIDRFTCIFHLLLHYLHVLTMIPPPKTPRVFFHNSNFSNNFSPTPFKMGKFCWSNLRGFKFFLSTCGSDIAVAWTTFPSGSSPKHHPRNGGTTGGWNHSWWRQQSQQKKKQQDEKNNCNLDDWPGRVFVNCWTLTSFEDCWGIRIWSKFTRFKLQLRFSSWPFRSSPRSMYWTKIDCNRPHVSGWQ